MQIYKVLKKQTVTVGAAILSKTSASLVTGGTPNAQTILGQFFGLTTILWQLANSQHIYGSLKTYLLRQNITITF